MPSIIWVISITRGFVRNFEGCPKGQLMNLSYLFVIIALAMIEITKGPSDICHGTSTCMAWNEHVLVGHAAPHDMLVDWAGLRILGTWALKTQHN